MQIPALSLLADAPRGRRRGRWPVVAAVATLGIVGSLMTGAPTANAAERSIAAQLSITDAVQDGTFLQDVVDGRIGVDQLVDAEIAGVAQGAPALDRATLTRGITSEVEQLRATGRVAAWGDDEDTGSPESLRLTATTTAPPVATQLSFWHKFTKHFHHWTTVRITAPVGGLLLGGGTALGIAAVVAGALGLLAAAIIASLGATVLTTLGAVAITCSPQHLKYLYLKFPDLGNSHCGN